MIKEALQYLIGLGSAEQHHIGGQLFSDKPLHLVRVPTADTIVVRALDGLIEYIIDGFDGSSPLLIHVASPTKVHVFSGLNQDRNREELIRAEALLPNIPFSSYHDVESFNVLLQSCFVANEGRSNVLRLVGNIKEEQVRTTGDNGVAQTVTAKSGISTVEDVLVPNPVLLKPYRTFVEIEQPESEFIFRLQNGPKAGLFEADGGAWKLTAMARIKVYLKENLTPLVEDGTVTIIG